MTESNKRCSTASNRVCTLARQVAFKACDGMQSYAPPLALHRLGSNGVTPAHLPLCTQAVSASPRPSNHGVAKKAVAKKSLPVQCNLI